jgi:hypothetical protein
MQEIELTKGYIALVDDEDFEAISAFKWHVLDGHPRIRYAARWIAGTNPRKVQRMHHVVLGVDPITLADHRLVVDHDDRNGLHNWRSNLKVVTRRYNILNSDYCDNALGIRWDNYRGMYKAVELPDSKFIGWFHTFEEAVKAKTR